MSTTQWRDHNPHKHAYEIQRGSAALASNVYVGSTEKNAVRQGAHMMREGQPFADETHVRLYHIYPVGGPPRRCVGHITRDGVLHPLVRL
jgi:hypothetical protein